MLKKVRITNFLSCQDTEIEFDNITAFIGRNAAGKTNILRVINWCAKFVVSNVSIYDYLSLFITPTTDCTIEFSIDNEIFKYEIKIATYTDNDEIKDIDLIEYLSFYKNNEWKLLLERNNDSATHYYKEEINFVINSKAPLISSIILLFPEIKIDNRINKVFNYLSKIKYYITDDSEYKQEESSFYNLIFDELYKKWLSAGKSSYSSVLMKILDLWHKDKESLEELEALIGKNGLNLIHKIGVSEFNTGENKNNFYLITFRTENTTVGYNLLSYGTQRILILLLALIYDKNSTLLIEQPEDGIHTGLLHKLLPLCFEYAEVYNKQLIITTHSSEAINLFQPENIRLVKMTENGTKVSSLDKEQMPFIRDYIENEGALFDFIKSMNDE
jgi:AAA15 family ATPase/GTPase